MRSVSAFRSFRDSLQRRVEVELVGGIKGFDELVVCISHRSALAYWRHVGGGFEKPSSSRTLVPAGRPPSLQELRGIGGFSELFDRGCFSYEAEGRLDVLVAADEDRRNSRDLKCHTWSVKLPRSAFAKIGNEVLVCSPEFLFLQMASDLSLIHLVELGYELCGSYALNSANERGFDESAPLTTASRIESFLEKAQGSRGLKRARRAVKYVLNGSASPMETTLAMLLTLPMSMGGFALPRPVLNERRVLKTGRGDETRVRRSDLFWPKSKLSLEYDSDLEHLGSRKFSDDAIRRNEFVLDGVVVVTVTRLQVKNLIEMRKVAECLCRHLGLRRRITLKDYAERQHKLYAELLSSGRTRV